MLWFTWRQFRTQTWVALAALAVAAVALVGTGLHLAALWTDSGAAACHANCDQPVSQFLSAAGEGVTGVVDRFSTITLYVLPALIGLFWGAPLVARELEAGTHRLAWNQTVSRSRWLATKLAVVGGASVAVTALLTIGVSVWARHLDRDDRIGPFLFGVRGIVPLGYAAFAFALGVTFGALIRRTVPAMAATLGVYIAAVAAMPLWIRAHLIPAHHTRVPLNVGKIDSLLVSPGGAMRVTGRPDLAGWILDNHTVTPTGQLFTGPADPTACGNTGFNDCVQWLNSLGLRSAITYQPLNRFWPLQFAETGLFLGLAALLVVVCFRLLRRVN